MNIPELRGGVSLVAALIGVFAVPQVLSMILGMRKNEYVAEYRAEKGVVLKTIIKVLSRPIHFLRSASIGSFIGILPGAGSPIAAIVSYNEAVRWSKDKSEYGKGNIHGVTASEIANNAAAPAAMIPLVTLGVPGSSPAAVIAGALMLRGLNPGPELFQTDGVLVYSFGWSLFIAGIVVFFIGMLATPLLVKIIKIPLRLLAPLIMFLAIIGAYAIRNNIFDVYLMLAIGIFVFLVRRLGFHPGPIGLGFILGPIIEPSLVQALYISDAVGVEKIFFSGPINITLISLSVISISAVAFSRFKGQKAAARLKA
jgi:putative tricarboxylic transport membrane protein